MAELDEAKLLSLAASISEGLPIDWSQLDDRTAKADESQVLRELRLLDTIATFHRGAGESNALPPWAEKLPPLRTIGSGGAGDAREAGPDLQTWGPLTIVQKVGEGAFGTVYRAHDSKLQREVALKLLAAGTTASSASPALKEARLLARLRHPNVATVYGADHIDGRVGLWMEFVKGRTLAQMLASQGPFSAREAALVGVDLCRALAAVHGAGLVHSDIKAHNVMREEGGRTVLMDFGTGKDLVRDHGRGRPGPVDDFAGTPLYLAPEVFDGHPRTKANDIYSLGVLLFHLLTDTYPVDGRTREDVERAHKAGARQHLRDIRADLPEEFVQTVERALATDPRERYQSAGAFESALARFLGAAGHTERGWITVNWRHTAVGVAAFAIVAAVAVPYWMSVRNSPRTSGTAGTVEDVAGRTDASSATPLRAADGRQPYTINTAVYRDVSGQRQRLRPGARVKPGDRLFVEVNASVPTYLYVVNEDEQGSALLLYPLPGQNATNPLPAGQSNRLPGARGGDEVFWVVDKNGGREHLLIFASPERLSEFEPVFASLGRPEAGRQIPPALVGRLRSIGGLATAPRPSGPSTATPRTSGPLTQLFTTPLGDAEENVRGAWIRQLTLENSSR